MYLTTNFYLCLLDVFGNFSQCSRNKTCFLVPKIGVYTPKYPPNHPFIHFNRGNFSMIFTIHFRGVSPYFWTPPRFIYQGRLGANPATFEPNFWWPCWGHGIWFPARRGTPDIGKSPRFFSLENIGKPSSLSLKIKGWKMYFLLK